jgi:hypothetical protein
MRGRRKTWTTASSNRLSGSSNAKCISCSLCDGSTIRPLPAVYYLGVLLPSAVRVTMHSEIGTSRVGSPSPHYVVPTTTA